MNTKTLGASIAELRKKQGMTQLELAKQMGVTDKAVSKWERDLSCPDINSFPHLAEILNASVEELMQIKTEPSKEKGSSEIVSIALKGVAAAMGIAAAVLSILGELDTKSGMIMLGLGLTSLALCSLQSKA